MPVHLELAQRAASARQRGGPVRTPHHHLAQQRVIERRHRAAGLHPRVDAYPGAGWEHDSVQATRARREAVVRILGVDPQFERAAVGSHLVLRECQPLARGDPQLLGDQVDAGDQLGDRVLHLDPGVHLDEEELAAVGVDQELNRAGAAIADRRAQRRPPPRTAARACRRPAAAPAPPRAPSGAGAAASSRARAGGSWTRRRRAPAPPHGGPHHEPLHVQPLVAERSRRLSGGCPVIALETVGVMDDPDPAPAAPAGGLERDRIADLAAPPACASSRWRRCPRCPGWWAPRRRCAATRARALSPISRCARAWGR